MTIGERKAERVRWRGILWALLVLAAWTPDVAAQDESFRTDTLAAGVFAIVRPVSSLVAAISNSLVILDDEGVTLVDSGLTPKLARSVLAEIRRLTDRPVRFVINTHWHDDHIFGNQAVREAFPDVRIVAHPKTRRTMVEDVAADLAQNREVYPELLADLEEQLRRGTDAEGEPLTDERRLRLEQRRNTFSWFIPQMHEMEVVPPDLTVDGDLILHRPGREIHIRYLGRGNTDGDLVVYLPREGILASGDLLVAPVPYAFGSFLGEWIETLGRLRDMDPQIIVPGHGDPQRDFEYLDRVRDLLRFTLDEVRAAAGRGLDLEGARQAVDLTGWRRRFTGGDPTHELGFNSFYAQPAIARAWDEIHGRLDEQPPR